MPQEIPLPQSVKLYKVEDVDPPLSVDSIESTSTSGGFNSTSSDVFYYKLSGIQKHNLHFSFYDKDVSCTRSPSYYSLDGFDNGLECRFINTQAPTITFFPLIVAQDKNTNVPLFTVSTNTYTLDNYTNYLSNNLTENDLVLLKNQTNNAENVIYRVQEIDGGKITLYNDILETVSVNSLMNQNQNKIFVRAKVSDSVGDYYYGLDNTNGFSWISQTKSVHLADADYGLNIDKELACNAIEYSFFSGTDIKQGDTVVINVLTNGSGSIGGKTSGVYSVSSISEGMIYLTPTYPAYVFVHQFVRVNYNINAGQSDIWYINPATMDGTNHLYNSVYFNFLSYNISDIIGTPNSWALQVGGVNDTIIGFSLFTNDTYNKFIQYSDQFSVSVKSPTWAEGKIRGLSFNLASD